MNSKSVTVNSNLDRACERCVARPRPRCEVSVHHRHLLSCRLPRLYKQSLLFSPRSLIGSRLWDSCLYSYRVVVLEVTRVQRLLWGATSCQRRGALAEWSFVTSLFLFYCIPYYNRCYVIQLAVTVLNVVRSQHFIVMALLKLRRGNVSASSKPFIIILICNNFTNI